MKYTNLSKTKYSNFSKQKDLSKTKSTTIDKDKNIGNSYRIGIVGFTKFKTSKNSPEKDTINDDRNFSGDRNKNIVQQTYLNTKNKIPNNKLREILEEGSALDLMKNKLMKKKEKLKTNILNFSNPFNSKMHKIQLETSANNQYSHQIKKDDPNVHKRSISTYEDEELNSHRKDDGKMISPRIESVFQKYYEIFDKKKNTVTNSSEWKKGKYMNNDILKNDAYKKSNKLINSTNSSIIYTATNKPTKVKSESRTAINTKPSSRKNSIEKLYGNTKNLFLNTNKQPTMRSTNTSTNNSSSTLITNKYNVQNHGAFNEEHYILNPSQLVTENNNKKNHIKVNSELPLNSMNLLEKKIIFKQSINKKEEELFKRKTGPISIPVTSIQSKNNSKSNSKSTSRIEDIIDKNIPNQIINQSKYLKKEKKNMPATTTSSPSHTKEILNNFIKKDEIKIKDKLPLKLYLDINNIKKDKTITVSKDRKKESFEKFLDNSNDSSILSTMRESNYYRKEADKISLYIKKFYSQYGDYPKTNAKFYKYGRLLGRGAFGKVNLALHVITGRLVAVKSFNKSKLTSDNAKKKIMHETHILKNLKHNSIVKIYETFETAKHIVIVMEYVCCGDLLSFVRKRSKLNETTAKFIFRQIIEALQFIHSQNIVHRDIKLDNILIDLQSNIKICDFGVSKQIRKGDIMHDQCGTPAYISPEILKNQGYDGFGVDIWSSGVVLYAMLSGTVPFKANNMNELHKMIIRGNYPLIKDISEEASNLLNLILEVDPKKRITTDQILFHPWLRTGLKSKMNLFTGAENILLSKSNIDYRFAKKDDLIENFTIKNLDTLQETENQNVNTKSIILAPFNSSVKNDEDSLCKELIIENEVLKFCGKVKELNRNYELNNNGEIDNGIIISPQDGNTRSNSNNNQYIPSPFNGSMNKIKSKPISPPEFEDKPNIVTSQDIQKNLVKNGNNLQTDHMIIDEKIVKEVDNLCYRKDYLIRSLVNNEINYATTAYYLLSQYSSEI